MLEAAGRWGGRTRVGWSIGRGRWCWLRARDRLPGRTPRTHAAVLGRNRCSVVLRLRGVPIRLAALAVLLTACEEDHSRIPRLIPELPAPPPIPEAARGGFDAPFRIRLEDVRGVVGAGIALDLPLAEAVVRGRGAATRSAIIIEELRLQQPDVTFPTDTNGSGPDFFFDVLEPRVEVKKLVVEDGRIGALAAREQPPRDAAGRALGQPPAQPSGHALARTPGDPDAPRRDRGPWLWRMRDVDLTAVDIRLGGRDAGLAERFEVEHANAAGEIRGRPFVVHSLALAVERTDRLLARGKVRLPNTSARGDFVAYRTNEWTTTLAADTFAFTDLAALIPQLGRAAPGGGAGVVTLSGERELRKIDIAWLRAASGNSLATARGGIDIEPALGFRRFRAAAAPVHAQDFERVFGVAIPAGTWTGWIAGDGAASDRIALRARLTHTGAGGDVSRLAARGDVVLEPEPFLDLALRAEPLRVVDTAFVARLDVVGPADLLSITGDVAVVGIDGVHATLDARLVDRRTAPPVLSGTAVVIAEPEAARRIAGLEPAARSSTEPTERSEPTAPTAPTAPYAPQAPSAPSAPAAPPAPLTPAPPAPSPSDLVAVAEGSVVLARDGAIDVDIVADSLPLALLPFPEGVDSVRGVASGRGRIGGTMDAPQFRARFTLEDGALFVEPLSLAVEEIEAEARLVDGLLVLDTLGARAGGGDVSVTGTIRLFAGPRRVDLAAKVDSVNLKDDEDGDVTASAMLALEGPLDRPSLTGRVHDLHGWIHEDAFQPDPVLDLDDPPYAELARRVPWPEDSELRRRARDGRPPPIEVRIVIEVDTAFSVVDDDSDIFGQGEVVVVTGDETIEAHGTLDVLGGYYAFFGERFHIVGGTARFEGGAEPRIAIKAEYREEWPVGSGRIATATRLFPPLEFLAIGPAGRPSERLTRWSLLPETQEELGALLIYDIQPQPVREWRRWPTWRPSNPSDLFDERSFTQSAALLWSYAADEAYNFIPLERGWLQAGTIRVGPGYPAPIVVGPMLGAGAIFDRFEVFVTQALDGHLLPGVRVRASGFAPFGAKLEAFSVPRFFPEAPGGRDEPGFSVRRKTGVGLFWEWEFGEGGRDLNHPARPDNPPPR